LVTIGLDADVGDLHLALSLFARFEAFDRRISTPPQCQIDPLYHDIMDFQPLLKGDPAGPARYFGLMRQGEN
jgi:hypothetical protein